MIRSATASDAAAVVALAVDSGLFPEGGADVVATMMADLDAGHREQGHGCLLDDDEDAGPVGVAYYQPAPATDGTWYLTMIAVRGDRQGQGRGRALLAEVEQDLRRRVQRLLLVETSGVPGFARTRAFYATCGYTEEARVRDYYELGDDMVLFAKMLQG